MAQFEIDVKRVCQEHVWKSIFLVRQEAIFKQALETLAEWLDYIYN